MAPDPDFQNPKMEERRRLPPGLPRDNPIQAYWQDPPDRIADCRTTPDLPGEADIVIVGSGVSGACIAYNLLSSSPGTKVVMLEARQAASGASGRNGRSRPRAEVCCLNFLSHCVSRNVTRKAEPNTDLIFSKAAIPRRQHSAFHPSHSVPPCENTDQDAQPKLS